jgi:yecA family protein
MKEPNIKKYKKINLLLKQHGALSIIELDGLLTSIISSPNLVPFNVWFSMTKIETIKFVSLKEKQNLIEFIMQFHEDIFNKLKNKTYRPTLLLDKNKSVEQIIADSKIWAMSYANGITTWHDFSTIINNKYDLESLSNILFPIMSLVASDRLRPEYESLESFTEFQIDNVSILPMVVITIYEFWLKRKKVYSETNYILH